MDDDTEIIGKLESYTPPETDQDWACVEAMQVIRRLRLRLGAVEALRAENTRLRTALELYTDDAACGLCDLEVSSGNAARAALKVPEND